MTPRMWAIVCLFSIYHALPSQFPFLPPRSCRRCLGSTCYLVIKNV